MTRYLGGLITVDETQVTPDDDFQDTSAHGVWMLAEAAVLNYQSKWPTAGNANIMVLVFSGHPDKDVDKISVATTGNATDWGGDIRYDSQNMCAVGSTTRSVHGGGTGGAGIASIEYLTFSSAGNGVDFGDLSGSTYGYAPASNGTRGVWGGNAHDMTEMEYITIASTGNASDFGDLTVSGIYGAGASSSTRGVYMRSWDAYTLDYITIASTGNATDFGDPSSNRSNPARGIVSNATRGLFGGGSGVSDVIDYITIASAGNATDFGNLTSARTAAQSGCSLIRAVFAGGTTTAANVNTIDYVTIASTGNASDFGDLGNTYNTGTGSGNMHGGLS